MKFYTWNCVYLCIWIFVSNKMVKVSESEGASKYVGEGVTYEVFLDTLAIFFTHAHLLMCRISQRSQLLMLSRRNIVVWCRMKHWWHHPMTYLWHHRPSYDMIGFPYKRRCTWPFGDLAWPGTLGSLWFWVRLHTKGSHAC